MDHGSVTYPIGFEDYSVVEQLRWWAGRFRNPPRLVELLRDAATEIELAGRQRPPEPGRRRSTFP